MGRHGFPNLARISIYQDFDRFLARISIFQAWSRVEQPRAAGAPPDGAASSLPLSSSPAQRELPLSSLLPPSIEQPRAAGAPPNAASSLPLSSSPAQRELPQTQHPPSLYRAAPRSGSSPKRSILPPPSQQLRAARQRKIPMKQPLPLIEQPRAAEAPQNAASSLPHPSSSVQRKIPIKASSLFLPLIEQPRAAGAPPKAASSLPHPSSSAQRELPQKQHPPCPNRRAPRRGSSPPKQRSPSPFPAAPPIKQPLPSFNRADYHARSTRVSESIENGYRKSAADDAGVCLAALSRCVISLSRCVTIPLRLQPVCQRGHASTGTGRPVFVRQGSSPQVAWEGRQRSSKLYPKVQIGTVEVNMGG